MEVALISMAEEVTMITMEAEEAVAMAVEVAMISMAEEVALISVEEAVRTSFGMTPPTVITFGAGVWRRRFPSP